MWRVCGWRLLLKRVLYFFYLKLCQNIYISLVIIKLVERKFKTSNNLAVKFNKKGSTVAFTQASLVTISVFYITLTNLNEQMCGPYNPLCDKGLVPSLGLISRPQLIVALG